MKKLLILLLIPAFGSALATEMASDGATNLPTQGVQMGGKGLDGKFHYFLLNNDGTMSATVTGGGDASAANQTSVQANPGSDATKAIAIQGVTGGKAVPVSMTGNSTNVAATNMVTGQVTAGAAGTLVIARATRRIVTIKNTDAAITVYIGPATVTAGNGMPLKAGESISVRWVGLVQVLAASGSPVVAYLDEYD